MNTNHEFKWEDHIQTVDSSLAATAIENVYKVDEQMLFHMNNLQADVQRDVTIFHPVIVAEFTPGGGKFTLLQHDHGKESRLTVEPVPNLFAIAKSIAHAPLGIFGCFGPYATNPKNQGWRKPLSCYRQVLADALETFDEIKDGFEVDECLKMRLVNTLTTVTEKFDGASLNLYEGNVIDHIQNVLKRLLKSSLDFIDDKALPLPNDESPAKVFQEWCNQKNDDVRNPDDTLYKLIVQSQVMSATSQSYGIMNLMGKWRDMVGPGRWKELYVIVEAEWVTREKNSIAQCILPEMAKVDPISWTGVGHY